MGKGGKTVNHKAKVAKKETIKATAPAPTPAPTSNGKKQEKAMKKIPDAMRARESDERKTALRNKIEVKRLQSLLQKTKDIVEGKEDDPKKDEWKYRVSSEYDLKGAARAAQEHYPDPNQKQREKKINYLLEYEGRLWEIPEGRNYLKAIISYGSALHNLMGKSKDAIEQFEEALTLDKDDHAGAQQQLLRLHLDRCDAIKARLILERFPNNKSACFTFNKALIEFISWQLQDEGTTKEERDQSLKAAVESNPYVIWLLAYHEIYEEIVSDIDQLLDDEVHDALVKDGSVEDALLYFESDLALWVETEGTIEWLREFITEAELEPPVVPSLVDDADQAKEEQDTDNSEDQDVTIEDLHSMYYDMFVMGCEAIEEQLTGGN